MASRRSKKIARPYKLWLAISAIFLASLFVGSVLLARADRWLITEIKIEGNKTVTDQAVRAIIEQELSGNYLFFYPKRQAWLYPRERILAVVQAAFPRLSNLRLSQPDWRRLELAVSERRAQFLWCLPDDQAGSLEECFFADETGFVFAPAPRFSRPLYLEFQAPTTANPLGRQVMPTGDFTRLVDFKNRLTTIVATSLLQDFTITRVVPEEWRDFTFRLQSETSESMIRFNLDSDLDQAARSLDLVLKNGEFQTDYALAPAGLQYLDLRFAPKIFYRYNE